jgi:hypothetical protein
MISEFFDCILEGRPFDEARATRQARRMRGALPLRPHPELADTQELPIITSNAELMAELESRAEVPDTRPARQWSQRALDRLLADVCPPSLSAMAIEAIRKHEALATLTPDWTERDGERVP